MINNRKTNFKTLKYSFMTLVSPTDHKWEKEKKFVNIFEFYNIDTFLLIKN